MAEFQREKRADEKFCSDCGSVIKLKAEICPACGVRQNDNTSAYSFSRTSSTEKNRFVAALLAFFIGIFGFHKFYLGRNFAGLMYLIFSWTAIPFLLALFDTLVLLLMSDEKFNLIYNSK